MRRPPLKRLRYWLWWRLADRPNVCPATSHSRVVWGIRDAAIVIGPTCLQEGDAACWCGKIRADATAPNGSTGASDA